MKLSLNWLKDFINVRLSPEKLGEKLTLAGFEVENIEKVGQDTVLDLKVTPNRADCLSILGLAREVTAITNSKLKSMSRAKSRDQISKLQFKNQKSKSLLAANKLTLHIENPADCPRMYMALLKGIKVSPSPKWMQERLISVGVKPINNVVDITNYLMFELGQPLHAFDAVKLANGKSQIANHQGEDNDKRLAIGDWPLTIYIRRGRQGEKITTLDGKERELSPEVLVLADEKGPIDIAGVQGGMASGIQPETTRIVLTCSQFSPSLIRRVSRAARFSTDASQRFERGLDPTISEPAFLKAIAMLCEHAGGILEAKDSLEFSKFKPVVISVTPDFIRDILGVSSAVISDATIRKHLASLGFVVAGAGKKWKVTVPSWRRDITLPEDLPEEIGCLIDYNTLATTPIRAVLSKPTINQFSLFKEKLKDLVCAAGFDEVKNYSFYGEEELKGFPWEKEGHYSLANPLNPDQVYMRRDLLPRLLSCVNKNFIHYEEIKIFEMGDIFIPTNPTKMPDEQAQLILVASGERNPLGHVLGVFHFIRAACGISENGFATEPDGTVAQIFINHTPCGEIGLIPPDILSLRKITKPVAFLRLSPVVLFHNLKSLQFKPFSSFPIVSRDISFVIDKKVAYEEIVRIFEQASPLIIHLELFDTFENKARFGENKWSMAFRLVFQHSERTLTNDEIERVLSKIRQEVTEKFQATIR